MDTFALFLQEVYSEDDLGLYTICRHEIEKEYGIMFHVKDKLNDESSRKYDWSEKRVGWIRLYDHGVLHDGTKNVHLSKSACNHVCKMVLEDVALASFIVNNIWQIRFPAASAAHSKGNNNNNTHFIFSDTFLIEVVKQYRLLPKGKKRFLY